METTLNHLDSGAEHYILLEELTIKAENSRPTMLRADTKWRNVGVIEQGNVLRTTDQVVILNSYNVFEAYIVVKDKQIAGYFLPTEKTFVAVEPMIVKLEKMEK